MSTIDEFFADCSTSKRLFAAVEKAIAAIGKTTIHVGKSQIAFKRTRNVATVWMPGKYLSGKVAPLVLTLSFPHPDSSPRWKNVVKVGPGRYTHHLELHEIADIDGEVKAWLRVAWDAA